MRGSVAVVAPTAYDEWLETGDLPPNATTPTATATAAN